MGFIRYRREFLKGRRIWPKDRVGRKRSIILIIFTLCCALSLKGFSGLNI